MPKYEVITLGLEPQVLEYKDYTVAQAYYNACSGIRFLRKVSDVQTNSFADYCLARLSARLPHFRGQFRGDEFPG